MATPEENARLDRARQRAGQAAHEAEGELHKARRAVKSGNCVAAAANMMKAWHSLGQAEGILGVGHYELRGKIRRAGDLLESRCLIRR